VKTLHRIEEAAVTQGRSSAPASAARGTPPSCATPDDARDWNDAPNAAGTGAARSDRFVLKFVRP